MDEYNCGDCARFYSVDEWNGECSKHGCVNCMSKICKDFILNDMRKEDEGNENHTELERKEVEMPFLRRNKKREI